MRDDAGQPPSIKMTGMLELAKMDYWNLWDTARILHTAVCS